MGSPSLKTINKDLLTFALFLHKDMNKSFLQSLKTLFLKSKLIILHRPTIASESEGVGDYREILRIIMIRIHRVPSLIQDVDYVNDEEHSPKAAAIYSIPSPDLDSESRFSSLASHSSRRPSRHRFTMTTTEPLFHKYHVLHSQRHSKSSSYTHSPFNKAWDMVKLRHSLDVPTDCSQSQ